MRTTMDRAGRLVLPREVRRRLGLEGGEQLDVEVVDGEVVLRVAPTAMSLTTTSGLAAAVPDEPLPPLGTETVRATIDATRR